MSEGHIEDHSSPIQTPRQFIVAVLLMFLVPIGFFLLVVQIIMGGLKVQRDTREMSEEAVAARLKPVGEVTMIATSSVVGDRAGEEVVKTACQACHGAGLLGAPKTGDKAGWKGRIAQGEKTLVMHAIKGIRAMPPKGGNPDLTDVEVTRAVIWMANQSGANFKEPSPTAPKPASAAAPAATAAGASPPAQQSVPAATTATAKANGANVYQTACTVCHGSGLAGAPKLGDKTAWKPRIAQGLPTLYEHALKGIRAMPPKGGNTALQDAEVTAAVDYMVSHSK